MMDRLTTELDYCDRFCEKDKNKCSIYSNCANRVIYKKLSEYEDLEEQGKLLKLPCKVGCMLYMVNKYIKSVAYRIITEIKIYEDEIVFIDNAYVVHKESDIGKIIFFTKVQAEEALQKFKESGGDSYGNRKND